MAIIEALTIGAMIEGLKIVSSHLAGYFADRALDKVIRADEKSLKGYDLIARQLYDALDEAYKAACEDYRPSNDSKEEKLEYDPNAVYDYLSKSEDFLSVIKTEEDVTDILRFCVGEIGLEEQGMPIELVSEDRKTFFLERLSAAISSRLVLSNYINNRGLQSQGIQNRDDDITPTVVKASAFYTDHEFDFFGRDDDIKEIQDLLQTSKVVVVCGEGGIGKTEVCRELIMRWPGICFSVNMIGCLDYYEMLLRISAVMGISLAPHVLSEKSEKSIAILEEGIIHKLKQSENILVYFDNYEDIIGIDSDEGYGNNSGTRHDEGIKATSFVVNNMRRSGSHILVSSRNRITAGNAKNYLLDTLDPENAVRLFCHIWGIDDIEAHDEREKIVRFVNNELENYPLSIVIAASQKDLVDSLDELMDQWTKIREELKNESAVNPRQLSLSTAIRYSWNQISRDDASRFAWELFLLFPDVIDKEELGDLVSMRFGDKKRMRSFVILSKSFPISCTICGYA